MTSELDVSRGNQFPVPGDALTHFDWYYCLQLIPCQYCYPLWCSYNDFQGQLNFSCQKRKSPGLWLSSH